MELAPIALLFFNRPDCLKEVFEVVSRHKPKKLFLICDGPRKNNPRDIEMVKKCQSIVSTIDWDAEVYRFYASENMGCKLRVSSGITAVFQQVDRCIILEDDCVPSSDFFRFCNEALETFKNDKKVFHISGYTAHPFSEDENYNCGFSRYPSVWGWATWKRAWDFYDVSIRDYKEVMSGLLNDRFFFSANEYYFWRDTLERIYRGKIDTWDYQWTFALFKQRALCLSSKKNLIKNIGFGPNATHTKEASNSFLKMTLENFSFPLLPPEPKIADSARDLLISKTIFRHRYLPEKLFNRAKQLLKKQF